MNVLRESPWYQEILAEGREEGLEKGREEGREAALTLLRRWLTYRFQVSSDQLAQLDQACQNFDLAAITQLNEIALEVETLAEFERRLAEVQAEADATRDQKQGREGG